MARLLENAFFLDEQARVREYLLMQGHQDRKG